MSPHRSRRWGVRRAFSLMESMVALAILGLLAALILPVFGATREASRRTQCVNHLHQLGVALNATEQTTGAFASRTDGTMVDEVGYWRLLPYLDQGPLQQQLVSAAKAGRELRPLPLLDVFICPSDSLGDQVPGNSNYYLNDGTHFHLSLRYGWNGFRTSPHTDTPAGEITDGLSNTAAMSEHLVREVKYGGLPAETIQRETGRYLWWTPRQFDQPLEEPLAAAMCRAEAIPPSHDYYGVVCWDWQCRGVHYKHILTPNATGCYNAPDPNSAKETLFLIPPTSLHPGGVNVLMADARVTFVPDSIDGGVWSAIGTRNGHEPKTLQ